MPLISIERVEPTATLAELMSCAQEPDLSDYDSDEDEDYNPQEQPRKKKKKLTKKRRKIRKEPDLTELSLPKAAQRLDPDLDLTGATLHGCLSDEHKLSALGSVPPPKGAVPMVALEVVAGRVPTRGTLEDERVVQYRKFYAVQLPGMPFYNNAYHLVLTADAGDIVSGGATFRFVDLTVGNGTRVLILDVLALAANPGMPRSGAGSTCVNALKALARREASAVGARPLLLTQADLSCVGFWAKQSFARALDATALVRSLRRASGHTIFSHATPMAHVVQPAKPPAVRSACTSVRRAGSPRRAAGSGGGVSASQRK